MFALILAVRASIRYEMPTDRIVSFERSIDRQLWHGSLGPYRGAIVVLDVAQPNVVVSAVSSETMSVLVREGPDPESWRTFKSDNFALLLGPNSTGGVVVIYNFETTVNVTSFGVEELGCSTLQLVNRTRLRFEEFSEKTRECFLAARLSSFVVVGYFENATEVERSNVTFASIKEANGTLDEIVVGNDGHYLRGRVSPLFVVSGLPASGFLVTVDVESSDSVFENGRSLANEFVCYNDSGEVPLAEMTEEPVFGFPFVAEDKGHVSGAWIGIICACTTVAFVGFFVMVLGVARLGKALRKELRRARGAREHSATGGWRLAL